MVAYLSVRFYNGALKDGGFKGPMPGAGRHSGEIQGQDRALYDSMTPNGCNPDGYVDLPSEGHGFYKNGYLEGSTTIDALVDHSFVDALKVIGP